MLKLTNTTYSVENISLEALAEKYGLPLYVYDTSQIKQQYHRLLAAFKDCRVNLQYACKALSNLAVMKYLKHLGAGLDTVSIQEVMLGFPRKILFLLRTGFHLKKLPKP